MQKIRQQFKDLIIFFKQDVWRLRLKDMPAGKRFLIRQLRIFLLVLKNLNQNKCRLHSSSLTLYTLLSIIPIAAMAFGIANGFGFERILEKQLLESLAGQEEVAHKIIQFSRSLLENTRGGVIAGIGMAFLFWTAITMLSQIERVFNEIWQVKGRHFYRKLSDYLAIMLICPILIIISSSMTVFIKTQVAAITGKISMFEMFSPMISFLFKLSPYLLIWILFILVYLVMPNTRVKPVSGIIAGLIAGTIYQLAQAAYISLQILMARYNAIYGSFAALPLFLIWLQLSWLIVLLGAEISHAWQNEDLYEREFDYANASQAFNRLLFFKITDLIKDFFSKGEPPATAIQISASLDIPLLTVQRLLDKLVQSGLISEVGAGQGINKAYQPACAIEILTNKYIVENLESAGFNGTK